MSPAFFSKYTEHTEPEFYTLWRASLIKENRELLNTSKLFYYNEGLIKKLRDLEKAFARKQIDPNEIARITAFMRAYSEARTAFLKSLAGTTIETLIELDLPLHERAEFVTLEHDYGKIELPRFVQGIISKRTVMDRLSRIQSLFGFGRIESESLLE